MLIFFLIERFPKIYWFDHVLLIYFSIPPKSKLKQLLNFEGFILRNSTFPTKFVKKILNFPSQKFAIWKKHFLKFLAFLKSNLMCVKAAKVLWYISALYQFQYQAYICSHTTQNGVWDSILVWTVQKWT
jgi:hypothetical protein